MLAERTPPKRLVAPSSSSISSSTRLRLSSDSSPAATTSSNEACCFTGSLAINSSPARCLLWSCAWLGRQTTKENCRERPGSFGLVCSAPWQLVYLDALFREILERRRMPGNAGIHRLLVLDLDVERLLVDLGEVVTLLEHDLGEVVGQVVRGVLAHRHDVPGGRDFVLLVLVRIGALGDQRRR